MQATEPAAEVIRVWAVHETARAQNTARQIQGACLDNQHFETVCIC